MSNDWKQALSQLDWEFKEQQLPIPDLQYEVLDLFNRRESHIAICGPYSNGKSCLLNALIGRHLLPMASQRETGVPIRLRHDAIDNGQVFLKNPESRLTITVDEQTISAYTSLLEADGSLREEPQNTKLLMIGLDSFPLPSNITLIDLPGRFDRTSEERVTEEERDADIIFWLTKSGEILSESEWSYLKLLIESKGTSAVVIGVNVIVRALDLDQWQERWQTFLNKELFACRARINKLAEQSGLNGANVALVPVAALPMLQANSDDFGRAALIACLASFPPDSQAVYDSRFRRIRACLSKTQVFLQKQLQISEIWEEKNNRHYIYETNLSIRLATARQNILAFISSKEKQLEIEFAAIVRAITNRNRNFAPMYYLSTITSNANKICALLVEKLSRELPVIIDKQKFHWQRNYSLEIQRLWEFPEPVISQKTCQEDIQRSVANIRQYWESVCHDIESTISTTLVDQYPESEILDTPKFGIYPTQWLYWNQVLDNILANVQRLNE